MHRASLRSSCLQAALLGALSLVAFASRASADPRVTVGDFKGPSAGVVRERAVAALDGRDVEVVPASEVASARDEVGDSPKFLSARLGIHAFIEGQVTRRGRRWSAKIRVVEGASGDTVETVTFNGRNVRGLATAVKSGLWNRIAEAVAGARSAAGGDDAEEPAPREEAPAPSAASSGKLIIVESVNGPSADAVTSALTRALEAEGHTPGDGGTAEATAEREGADLGSASGRVAVARELGAAGFVDAKLRRQGRRKFRAVVSVYNGRDGERLGQATFVAGSGGALAASIEKRFAVELGAAVNEASVPGEEPVASAGPEEDERPPGMEDDEEDEDADDADDGESSAASALAVVLRGGGFWRSFAYKDDLNDNLLTYSLGPAPHVGLEGQWYPAAHFTDGFAANLGIDASFGMALGVESEFQGKKFSTSAVDWSAGLRFRLPFDRDEVFAVLGLGGHSFSISGRDDLGAAGGQSPDIPDVSYMYLRAGLGGLLWFGPISLRGRGAFLLGLGAGDSGYGIQSKLWFPDASVNGLEGGAEVGFELLAGLEARLGFSVQYFFYTLNPKPTDFRANTDTSAQGQVAGGATDWYPMVTLGVSYTMPAN